jgi:hypothetical protein
VSVASAPPQAASTREPMGVLASHRNCRREVSRRVCVIFSSSRCFTDVPCGGSLT